MRSVRATARIVVAVAIGVATVPAQAAPVVDEPVWSAAGWGYSAAMHPDGSTIYIGGSDELIARDAETGALAWSIEPGFVPLRVAVDPGGSMVVAASEDAVAGFDPTAGGPIWTTVTGRTIEGLAVGEDGSQVFVLRRVAGDQMLVQALAATTGAAMWNWQPPEDSRPIRPEYPTPKWLKKGDPILAQGDSVFVVGNTWNGPGWRMFASAIDITTGETRWRWEAKPALWAGHPGSAAGMAVAPDGSMAYALGVAEGDYLLAALATDTGSLSWTALHDGIGAWAGCNLTACYPWATVGAGDRGMDVEVSPDGTTVFVGGESRSTGGFGASTPRVGSGVVAFDASDGSERWRSLGIGGTWVSLNDLEVDPTGSVVVAVGGRLISTAGYYMRGFDVATGAEVWMVDGPQPSGATRVLLSSGGRAYIAGTHTAAYCVTLECRLG